MLIVAALQLGDPVLLVVLVETNDSLFHRGRAYDWKGMLTPNDDQPRYLRGALCDAALARFANPPGQQMGQSPGPRYL